jgi:DNA-binding LacI/PurR family transcriptional regulator
MLDKGRCAARLLFQLLAGGEPQRIILPTRLVARDTTGLLRCDDLGGGMLGGPYPSRP